MMIRHILLNFEQKKALHLWKPSNANFSKWAPYSGSGFCNFEKKKNIFDRVLNLFGFIFGLKQNLDSKKAVKRGQGLYKGGGPLRGMQGGPKKVKNNQRVKTEFFCH